MATIIIHTRYIHNTHTKSVKKINGEVRNMRWDKNWTLQFETVHIKSH